MDPTDRPEQPRDPAVAPGGDRPAPEAGRETQDVSIPAIVKFGIGLAVITALVSVAMWGLFRVFAAQEEKHDQPVPPMVAASLQRTPREPRLEPNPLAPRLAARARENAALLSYGWVDRSAGIARIPIDRAMELLVARGLPPAKTPTAVTPLVTPGAGTRNTGHGTR
jgi:hypothetical protein